MSGYQAAPDAIAAAAGALREAADALAAARAHLDESLAPNLGPGLLPTTAADLMTATARTLDHLNTTLLADADLATTIGRTYADLDHTAATTLTRGAG